MIIRTIADAVTYTTLKYKNSIDQSRVYFNDEDDFKIWYDLPSETLLMDTFPEIKLTESRRFYNDIF